MRVLIVLTYYQPYTSGLTLYAVRKAKALVGLGHDVTILTSRFDESLPEEEIDDGVHIIRVPVAFRLSKGVVMPKLALMAWKWIKWSDVVNLHLPQIDAALISLLAKLRRKPIVITYHCDLTLPKGLIHKTAERVSHLLDHLSAALANVIVHNTRDYAENSPFLKRYLKKLRVVPPPIIVEPVSEVAVNRFLKKYEIQPDEKVIGMVARLAAEKGVEYLLEALPEVLLSYPKVRVIYVGEYKHVLGEEAYRDKMLPLADKMGKHWNFIGRLSEQEKAIFYQRCDVVVVPSINSTESFGMVQVEAMICGTPVIASDLPGVRQPVKSTGMGKIVAVKDATSLANAIIEQLHDDQQPNASLLQQIKEAYAPQTVAKAYTSIYESLRKYIG